MWSSRRKQKDQSELGCLRISSVQETIDFGEIKESKTKSFCEALRVFAIDTKSESSFYSFCASINSKFNCARELFSYELRSRCYSLFYLPIKLE
jgi:hypothetical protein